MCWYTTLPGPRVLCCDFSQCCKRQRLRRSPDREVPKHKLPVHYLFWMLADGGVATVVFLSLRTRK